MVLPGKISASLAAMGQETFNLPDNIRLMVGWLRSRRVAICSCVIMALIISNKFLYVNTFIGKYNNILEAFEIITNYTLALLIKGGVL